MIAHKAIAVLVAAALCFTALAALQHRIDRTRPEPGEEQLLYLPNEKLLNHFTAGMSTVIADMLWLKCLQYTGKHFQSDLKFTWLSHMCNTIVRLDPYFVDAYRFGGIFLAALQGDDNASVDLLKKGIRHNPSSWELPYEIAMVYLLNRKDAPGSAVCAGHYLSLAVATKRAPDWVIDFAANIQNQHNMFDTERQMWARIQESGDQLMRNMATRKLIEIDLREVLPILNEGVAIYTRRTGSPPSRIEELLDTGIVNRLPEDPLGGRFFIDRGGVVQSTTLLDGKVTAILNDLRRQIDQFRQAQGRWPASLQELVDTGIAHRIWNHPHADRQWKYDPATGEVS